MSGFQLMINGLTTELAEANQSAVALGGVLIGCALTARGFALVKGCIVTALACWSGRYAFLAVSQSVPAALAFLVAVLTGFCVLQLSHRAYPLIVFLLGALLGGVGAFAGHALLGLDGKPASFLGLLVLTAVFTGLAFRQYRDVGWRVLTPPIGGLLIGAGLRYWAYYLLEGTRSSWPMWSYFVKDLQVPEVAIVQPCGAVFLGSWIIASLLGWYFQLAQFFGEADVLELPEQLAQHMDLLRDRLPCFFDSDANEWIMKRSSGASSTGGREEPLLMERQASLQSLKKSTLADYRPEAAVLLAVASVLVLNAFLASQPLLFLGHVILMSSAFLPLLTAGLMSYASPNRVLPQLFGPISRGPLLRHFTHGSFNTLALVCAIGGYLCIYWNHKDNGQSQLGLDKNDTWVRSFHVWNGYLILTLMFGQCLSGVAKLVGKTLGKDIAPCHGNMGRLIYGLAAINQLLGYFFPGLIPLWGSMFLAVMLLATISATHFYLAARHKENEESQYNFGEVSERSSIDSLSTMECGKISTVTQRLESLRIPGPLTSRSSQDTSSTRSRSTSPRKSRLMSQATGWEVVLDTLDKSDKRAIMKSCFADWHRSTQSAKLVAKDIALQGTENLVSFLSEALVNDPPREM